MTSPPEKLSFKVILEVVEAFYQKANHDILIGYHFRVIENFETHFPRIATFWQLQLTGSIDTDKREELPFNLLNVHKPLKINKGEVHRWVILFEETLDSFISQKKISSIQKILWMEKIDLFKNKILTLT